MSGGLVPFQAAAAFPRPAAPAARPAPRAMRVRRWDALLVCLALFGAMLLAQGTPDILRRWRPARWRQRHVTMAPMTPLFAISWAICSLLLVEPIVWIFYYILLLAPLAWLISALVTDGSGRGRGRGRAQAWLLVGLVGYLIATLVFPLDPRTAEPMSAAFVLGIAVHPVGLALVWLAHAGYYLQARRHASYVASAAESVETKAHGGEARPQIG